MIFHPGFRQAFTLAGRELYVASLTPADRAHIRAGLKLMSAESIRNRFMGSKRDFTERELDYLTSFDGLNHYALGIEEAAGLHRGVAVTRMVRSEENPEEAEVAITIIDEFQKMGIGSLLLDLLTLAALERGITSFSFTFLPHNEAIARLIRKKGVPQVDKGDGTVRMALSLLDIDLDALRSRVRSVLPEIGSGHSGI